MGQDTEFMSELEAATRMKPVTASNVFLFAIASMIAFFVIWACLSEVEELTRGTGQVVPVSETQVIQSLEGGILEELLVSEGDVVEKGQILLRISDVTFASEERGTEARFRSLSIKKARLNAEAEGKDFSPADVFIKEAPQIVENERALYVSRQKELANSIAIINEQVSRINSHIAETKANMKGLQNSRGLLYQELKITKQMVAKKAVPKLEEIRLQRELSQINGQISVDEEKLPGLQAELDAAAKEREDKADKFRSQALGELNDVETQIMQIKENLTSIGDRVDRAELRSPVHGIVNNVAVKTLGGVIEPAQQLIEIVPVDEALKIMAQVRPSDIAFLEVGQQVKVKVTAYDPQKFGSLDGELVRISANSVQDRDGNVFFEVEVRTDKNHFGSQDKKLVITPGMEANVEVVTGKRTIMEYLMKPILRARSVALTER